MPAGLLRGFVSLVTAPSLAKSALGRCSDDVDCSCTVAYVCIRAKYVHTNIKETSFKFAQAAAH